MLSIVIPVYDEVQTLDILVREINEVAREYDYQVEIIIVDDGSTDGSWTIIQDMAKADERVRGIRLRRNFGKAAALSAGFNAALGEIVFTLDADLQDDPVEFPRFLEAMNNNLDVVSGWKLKRHDPWHKVFPSRIFNWACSYLTGVHLHDHNCGFKCYRRQVLNEIHLYGELHRFVPVLASSRGYRVGEVVVRHRPRRHGRSKYGFGRLPKGFLDLLTVRFLTGFGQRPQHVLGTLGLLLFSVGCGGIAVLTVAWFLTRAPFHWGQPIHLTERAVFFYSIIALLFGGQLISIGLLAELLASHVGRESTSYSIAEQTATPGNNRPDRPPVKNN